MANHRYAALVGNGLSIPYNANLSVPSLTTALINDLTTLSGSPAGSALAAFAQSIRGMSASGAASNFELLLGPLDAAAAALPHLLRLASLVANAAHVQTASRTVSDFAEAVHQLGLGRVLDRIARESEATLSDPQFVSTVRHWVESFHALPSAGIGKAIGTLNYDGLVHAAALDLHLSPADLSTGYNPAAHGVVAGQPDLHANKLRNEDNLPSRDLEILNLHGSLGWLRSSAGEIWKFELGDLRTQDYWNTFSTGQSSWDPVVILTDQKAPAVAERPFSLAYDVFRNRLALADRWMIVGYGLGDEPVNSVLQTAAKLKPAPTRADLTILCIDYRKEAATLKRRVAQIVGVAESQVLVDVTGIPTAIGGGPWIQWAS